MIALDSSLGAARSARTVRVPAILFFVAILATTLAHWPLLKVSGIPIQWVDAAVALLYLALLLECFQTKTLPRTDALLWPTVLFMATLALSCVGAPHPLRSVLKLLGFTPYLLLPVLGAAILKTPEDLRLAVRGFWISLGFSIAIGLLTIVVFYSDRRLAGRYLMCGYGGLPSLPIPRLCAPFANPNALFNHLLSALCIFAVTGYARLGMKVTLAICALVVCVAVFTTSGGLAALVVSAALLLGWAVRGESVKARAIRFLARACALASVIGVTLAMSGAIVRDGSGHINVGGVGYALGEAARPPIWRGAANSIAAHPLFGLGYGEAPGVTNDPRAWRVHDDWQRPHDGSYHSMDAHNAWLNVAGQAGLFGLGAFIWLVASLWRRVQDGRQRAIGNPLSLADGLAAALAGFFVHSFLGSFEEARGLWLLLAMAIAVSVQSRLPKAEVNR